MSKTSLWDKTLHCHPLRSFSSRSNLDHPLRNFALLTDFKLIAPVEVD